MTHDLKILPMYFEDVVTMVKPFEVRKYDRAYAVGDTLLLREYDVNKRDYTGRATERRISYILDNDAYCKEGFVILGLR